VPTGCGLGTAKVPATHRREKISVHRFLDTDFADNIAMLDVDPVNLAITFSMETGECLLRPWFAYLVDKYKIDYADNIATLDVDPVNLAITGSTSSSTPNYIAILKVRVN